MKTLYEILEVSESASDEIIEKAYRVLVKKYHPDLQTVANKIQAEEKMKQINEAYDVLSNQQKRKDYDDELKRKREEERQKQYKEQQNIHTQNQQQNNNYQRPNPYQNSYNNSTTAQYDKVVDMQRRRYQEQLKKEEAKMRKQMENQMQEDYTRAYYNYLKSLGYRIKEKWTWKKTKNLLITIGILIVIGTILWILPPTHNIIMYFYESNPIIKFIVDLIGKIFQAFFQTIFGSK